MSTEELIIEIEQELEMDMKVYVHKDTLSLLMLPDDDMIDFADDEFWENVQEELEKNSENYIEVEKWDASHSFRIMESFAENISGNRILQAKLLDALENSKPFKNFRNILDRYEKYLQEWYSFRALKQREFVKKQLTDLNIIS